MFVGDDPRHVPMRIFPGVHYSMGGFGLTTTSARIFPDCSRPVNATTQFTARIVWEQTRS